MIVNHAGTRDHAHPRLVNEVMVRDHTGSEHVSRAMKIGESSALEIRDGTAVPVHMHRTALMREMQRRAAHVAPPPQGAHRDTTAVGSKTGDTAVGKASQIREIRATLAFKAGQSALLAASRPQRRTALQRSFLKATTNTLTLSSLPLKTKVMSGL
jgi:hypothetical protein